ncbi:MAG TPA: 16S rRNA (adenine(1518)-N(6)/adenine(1519)-N(6))-dimethyltransferase RsmA [Actinomycetota bacterium]|nr:16S rRNA (adenine(1518)-N(6)/adenine(1519)-N(6))-dimethyltransferase RsmA [Actinomycetota bacterium]
MTLGAARTRELLERHAIRPSKSLGQNFVIDPNTVRKIVRLAGVGPDDRVLEIGPGAGSLTLELARAARAVVAVETDSGLFPVLEETLAGVSNVEVIAGDAMQVDLGSFGANRLVANLPYNIAAPLVVRSLQDAPGLADLTVMAQKEVGERLAAPVGSKVYGQVSVIVAFFAEAKVLMQVSRQAFYPVPNVDSVVVRITRREPPTEVDRTLLFEVVRTAFSQRRKTLRNSLGLAAGSPEAAEKVLTEAGVGPGERPERVDLGEFVRVARALERHRLHQPG